ncbi:MAG: PAS domain-containing protein [Alphaproteobacteria bacterium]|nr:PAS domain-containing protein [Alphaproteobacteria bacterium]MBL7098758.1 PAS domain-containing protein [Alphaproteobacteria bacterium]
MRDWKLSDACQAIAKRRLHGPNVEVASYWLSLWSSNAPPTRVRFDPKCIATRLPAVAMMSVQTDGRVIFWTAGNYLRLATGIELTGKDLMTLCREAERAERARTVKALLNGGVFCGHRPIKRQSGVVELVQEIALPFAGHLCGRQPGSSPALEFSACHG